MLKSHQSLIFFIVFLFIIPCKVFCASWNGRFTLGTYSSTERFNSSTATGSDKNDFQTLSSRLFLHGEGLGAEDTDFIMDIRDKHDFFDKLNAEKLSLESRNEFQLRSFFIRKDDFKRLLGFSLGRFSILEAGSKFVDGLQIVQNWNPNFYSSLFGGYNPQQREKSYVVTDPKASTYGGTLTFQGSDRSWQKNFYSTTGYVTEIYDGHIDRQFLYQQINFQWSLDSRLFGLLYLDFVPKTKVQNGLISLQNKWESWLSSEISHSAIDVIEYSRRKEVLEKLPSSPYREDNVKINFNLGSHLNKIYILGLAGQRESDQLTRQSIELGLILSQVFSQNWDLYMAAGTRENFTSKDVIEKLGLGRFGRRWEFTTDLEFQQQKTSTGSKDVVMVEGSASYFLNKQSFLTFSGLSAQDNEVKILSAFLKYGFRFGDREVPPLRDGAPPRGRI